MLDPVYEEKVIGHAEVRQIFKASAIGNIAGSYVLDGVFQRGCKVRITREGEQIFEGNLASLKRFKDDVKEVKAGYECGLVFEGFDKMQELDLSLIHILEIYDVEYVKEGSDYYLRAYIDKPEGVNILDCENVSRALSEALDKADFIPDAYILEVSSPGLGRTLKKDKHLQKSIGEEVEIKLFKPDVYKRQIVRVSKTPRPQTESSTP